MAVALVPSIVPDGNRDTFTQTPTHGSGAVDIGGLQPSLGAVAPAAARPTRSTSRASTDMFPGGTANAYKTWLQTIAPENAARSYIEKKA